MVLSMDEYDRLFVLEFERRRCLRCFPGSGRQPTVTRARDLRPVPPPSLLLLLLLLFLLLSFLSSFASASISWPSTRTATTSNPLSPTAQDQAGPSSSSLSHLCRLFARKTKTQQLSDWSLLLLLLIFFLFATSEAQMLVHWSIVKSLQNHFDKVHLLIERPLSRNLTAKRDWLPSGTKNLRLSYSYLTNLILK